MPTSPIAIRVFAEHAKALNGCFAAIRISAGRLEAVTDRIRSYPLFYGLSDDRLVLSDDARFVQSECGTNSVDPVGQAEFLRTAQLVWGGTPCSWSSSTSSCWLIFDRGRLPEGIRWTDYRHHENPELSKEELLGRLDDAMMASMGRLIEVAGDAPIVLPLSGGNDSRLLLLMLRRLGHENVVTFTYGKAGYREAAISENVAAKLGYTWHFVPYTPAAWRRWAVSQAAHVQHQKSHHLSVLPHIQDARSGSAL